MSRMTLPVVDSELMTLIEECEAQFYALRLERLRALPGNPYGVAIRRMDGVYGLMAEHAEDYWVFNRVMGMNHRHIDHLDELIQWYRSHNIRCRFDITPSHSQPDLLRKLVQQGLYQADFFTALYGLPECSVNISPHVTVRAVQTHEGDLMARLYLDGFEVSEERRLCLSESIRALVSHPQIRCYFAYVDSSLAGMAVLFLYRGVGYLASGTTLPEFRRHGCQTALLHARINAAAVEGCHLITAHADVLSLNQRTLERLGLRVAYTKVIWTEL